MANRFFVAVAAACLAVFASADEIFVDAKNGKDGEGRGSDAAPYLTIQASARSRPAARSTPRSTTVTTTSSRR